MIEFLTRFLRITSQSILNKNTFVDYVMPVVVRHEVFQTLKECETQFQKIIDLYDQKVRFKQGLFKDDLDILEVLNSPQYPNDEEFEPFMQLVKMIKENITFIHPKDVNKQNIENFSTCQQLYESTILAFKKEGIK